MKKIILIIVIFTTFSCSEDEGINSDGAYKGILLKSEVSSGRTLNYFYEEGNKLSKIVYTGDDVDSWVQKFTYENDLIVKSEYFYSNSNQVGSKEIFRYENNKLIQSIRYYSNSEDSGYTLPPPSDWDEEPSTTTDFIYNSDGSKTIIWATKDYIESDGLYGNYNKSINYFDEVGNVIKRETFKTANSSGRIDHFNFDSKNTPYKNIVGVIHLGGLFGYNNNEVENYNEMNTFDSQVYYEYNSYGYPISSRREYLHDDNLYSPVTEYYYN